MDELSHIDLNSLHHAYLIEGESEFVIPILLNHISSWGVAVEGNPDLSALAYEGLSIDDARNIKASQQLKSAGGGKKFFLLDVKNFTREAEHALLKVFEEPAEGVHFFVITPKVGELLDTLRSRMVFLRLRSEHSLGKRGLEFLRMAIPLRLNYVASLIKEHDKDETSSQLKETARKFLNEIEHALHENIDMKNISRGNAEALEEIGKVRDFLFDRGASIKMILEHVCLIVPHI